jgi:hypothetical protein
MSTNKLSIDPELDLDPLEIIFDLDDDTDFEIEFIPEF